MMKTNLLSIVSKYATLIIMGCVSEYVLANVTNTNAAGVVELLRRYPLARTSVSSFEDSDFREKLHVVQAIFEKDLLPTQTNALLSVADYLAEGNLLPVDNYSAEIRAAHKADRFHEFGDSNYVVRAGSGYFGPLARACRQQYTYRRAYNSNLSEFRIDVFRSVASELARTRWNIYPENVRNALLQEFYRRANMTEEEERRVSR